MTVTGEPHLSAFQRQLVQSVGDVVTRPESLSSFRRDQAVMAPAGTPLIAVRARSVQDVIATVRLCNEFGVPLVTRGAGTGLAGGANAIDGCAVISMTAMNRILSIDPTARTATVEPGVINSDLDRAARAHGMWFAPDPGSRDICSIGGNLATNAGGMCCAKYGVTRDHVLQTTAVLGTGEVIRTGRATRKNGVGLDLTSLLVGSEGTLAILVEATVRLRTLGASPATVAATFPSVSAAVDSVVDLTARCEPAALELMDAVTIRAVNDHTQMALDESGAVILAQFDGEGADGQASLYASIVSKNDGVPFQTDDISEGTALMAARRAAVPALEGKGTILLDDVAVPVHRLPELIASIEDISRERSAVIATFGHAADGNLHPTIVFDASQPAQVDAAKAAFGDILEAALALDGTVTGEHGVGSLKRAYADQQIGSLERALMRRIKDAFDPEGIMNPGKGY